MNVTLANLIAPTPPAALAANAPAGREGVAGVAPPKAVGKKAVSPPAGEVGPSRKGPSSAGKGNVQAGRQKPVGKNPNADKTDGETVLVGASPAAGAVEGASPGRPAFYAILQAAQVFGGSPAADNGGEAAAKALRPEDLRFLKVMPADEIKAGKNTTGPALIGLGKENVIPPSTARMPLEAAGVRTGETPPDVNAAAEPGNVAVSVQTGLPVRILAGSADVQAEAALPQAGGKAAEGLPLTEQAGTGQNGRNEAGGGKVSLPPGMEPSSATQGETPALPVVTPAVSPLRQHRPASGPANGPAKPVAVPHAAQKAVLSELSYRPRAGAAGQAENTQTQAQGKLDAFDHNPQKPARVTVEGPGGQVGGPQIGPQQVGAAGEPVQFDTGRSQVISPDGSLPASATNQIAEALRASAASRGGQVVIRLNPPELGRVRVILNVEGREVRGVLEVDNPSTLSQIQREAPALLVRLADAGIQLRQIDVSLSDRETPDSSPPWHPGDDGGAWHGGADDQTQQPAEPQSEPDEAVAAGAAQAPTDAIRPDEGSINLWI